MTSIRKSFAVSFAQKYATLVIWTVTAMIVARLLTPQEIGVFSVSVAIVHIAHMLRDFGIQGYLIQERELTPARVRTAFTITLIMSWTMAAMLVAVSGPFATFYDEPGSRPLLVVLSLTFVVIPFNSTVLALMRRDMQFSAISVITVVTAFVQASATVALAAEGFSYMCYAWASLVGAITTAAMAGLYRRDAVRVWPGLAEWRRVAGSGARLSASVVVHELGSSANDLIIGRILGFAAVGIYSKALGLMNLFHQEIIGVVNFVSIPAMAARDRAGHSLREPTLQAISMVTALGWPFYAVLALMALPILRVMFGNQWDAAAPLVEILALAGALGLFWPLGYQVLFALGRLKLLLNTMLIITCFRVAATLAAASYSLAVVAWALVATFMLSFLIYLWCMRRLIDLRSVDILAASWRSAVIALAAAAAPLAVKIGWPMDGGTPLLPLMVAGAGAGIGWLAGVFVTGHPIKREILMILTRVSPRLGRMQPKGIE
ncbi:MAG: lipopolysaccharide biosynthesis protein [Rhodospirillaceae bacterium]